MKKAVDKLIDEYQQKIDDCDKLIVIEEGRKRSARKAGRDLNDHQRYLAVHQAQRQCYVQARVDIESLLDEVE